uniref:protein CUSTOS isoform X3 n=1 Tax=Ictidomys tridecemlineatus TaxID=43179 RepID=UPI001A9F9996|nr:protein CUSTOS isoform X3 [Ictidomys tridecemlineatus]
MAAPGGAVRDSESSSSSEEEELARCREAAMSAWDLEQRPRGAEKPRADAANNKLPAPRLSLRHKVDEHEQDGNELQTTPEFRAHIAKKLGALLDSSITISEVVKAPRTAKKHKVAPEDDGFRLFFTSIPGGGEEEASPRPRPKRQPSSSSFQISAGPQGHFDLCSPQMLWNQPPPPHHPTTGAADPEAPQSQVRKTFGAPCPSPHPKAPQFHLGP